MRSLLRTDFKRVLKDKLFLVLAIVAVAFAGMMPVLYKLIFSMLDAEEMMGMVVDAKTLFFTSFAAGDNLGLIVPVLIIIILCKDFSFGTVRNKIISGKTRTQIFASTFITCAVFFCAVILVHALLCLAISLIFFDYQQGAFTWGDFWYLLSSIALELLVWVFIAALCSFLCVFMKNAGLAVVVYVAIAFLFTIIGAVVSASLMFADQTDKFIYELLKFLSSSNLFTNQIGQGTSYSFKDLAYLLIPAVFGTAAFVFLGIKVFNNKDLK